MNMSVPWRLRGGDFDRIAFWIRGVDQVHQRLVFVGGQVEIVDDRRAVAVAVVTARRNDGEYADKAMHVPPDRRHASTTGCRI
jgi:hypothetical protein